jgi:hypothetical protein
MVESMTVRMDKTRASRHIGESLIRKKFPYVGMREKEFPFIMAIWARKSFCGHHFVTIACIRYARASGRLHGSYFKFTVSQFQLLIKIF